MDENRGGGFRVDFHSRPGSINAGVAVGITRAGAGIGIGLGMTG